MPPKASNKLDIEPVEKHYPVTRMYVVRKGPWPTHWPPFWARCGSEGSSPHVNLFGEVDVPRLLGFIAGAPNEIQPPVQGHQVAVNAKSRVQALGQRCPRVRGGIVTARAGIGRGGARVRTPGLGRAASCVGGGVNGQGGRVGAGENGGYGGPGAHV